MSYDLDIFCAQHPEDDEESYAPLDQPLALQFLRESLQNEKCEWHEDEEGIEIVWFLSTRTAVISLWSANDALRSISANLVWGDRSQTEQAFSTPPPAGTNEAQEKADATRIFTLLLTLADRLKANLYDPQDDMLLTWTSLPEFVGGVSHHDATVRQVCGQELPPQGRGNAAGTTEKSNRRHLKWMWAALMLGLLVAVKTYDKGEQQQRAAEIRGQTGEKTGLDDRHGSEEVNTPKANIWVDENRVIHRSELKNAEGTRMLTWVIQINGVTQLERNAENEMQYRYYRMQPGTTMTAYLKAYYNGAYHTVSNVIDVQIPK